ncbi:hypothetical protein Tco_0827535 [Tanacetum coccineum]
MDEEWFEVQSPAFPIEPANLTNPSNILIFQVMLPRMKKMQRAQDQDFHGNEVIEIINLGRKTTSDDHLCPFTDDIGRQHQMITESDEQEPFLVKGIRRSKAQKLNKLGTKKKTCHGFVHAFHYALVKGSFFHVVLQINEDICG